jgi:hypothetical protein
MAGVSAQVHVGFGHVGMVGKGGSLELTEEYRTAKRLGEHHVDLISGRTNIEDGVEKLGQDD